MATNPNPDPGHPQPPPDGPKPGQPPGQPKPQSHSGSFAPPKKGTHTTAPRELDPNKDGFATVRDNADFSDDPERPFEPRNEGMEAKDWPRGPMDVKVKGDEGVIDSSIRGYGLRGGQREQPDQSGVDPDATPSNPGWDMLRARQEAEKNQKTHDEMHGKR